MTERIGQKGSSNIWDEIAKVQSLINQGDYKGAITLGEKVLRDKTLARAGLLHLAGNAWCHAAADEFAKPNKATPSQKVEFLEKAINNFTEAAQLCFEVNYPEGAVMAICNRAICLQELGKGAEALKDFRHSLELAVSDSQRETLLRLGALHSLSIQETHESER